MIAGNANNVGKESTVIKCKGGTGEDEIKCVSINSEPKKDYSLVVGIKSSRFQDIHSGTLQVRELGVDEKEEQRIRIYLYMKDGG